MGARSIMDEESRAGTSKLTFALFNGCVSDLDHDPIFMYAIDI